jgi:large conductance mechanosensitive channel
MTGFKNFILRGNLIELAVAFIMAAAFAAVVTAFVAWLTSLMPDTTSEIFSKDEPFGAFLNAVISFLLLAAVIYFFVVLPYTKAKERWFPAEEPGTPADVAVLEEIRDLLAAQGTQGTPGTQGNRPL